MFDGFARSCNHANWGARIVQEGQDEYQKQIEALKDSQQKTEDDFPFWVVFVWVVQLNWPLFRVFPQLLKLQKMCAVDGSGAVARHRNIILYQKANQKAKQRSGTWNELGKGDKLVRTEGRNRNRNEPADYYIYNDAPTKFVVLRQLLRGSPIWSQFVQ